MSRSKHRKILLITLGIMTAALCGNPASARDYTAGEGGAAEIDACAKDAARYCNDDIMWQHEMEECLTHGSLVVLPAIHTSGRKSSGFCVGLPWLSTCCAELPPPAPPACVEKVNVTSHTFADPATCRGMLTFVHFALLSASPPKL